MLQMVGMQDGGMYSSMKECINIPVQEWAVYQTPIPMSTKTCGLGMRLNIVYSRGINYKIASVYTVVSATIYRTS